jgi:hypothetical protein
MKSRCLYPSNAKAWRNYGGRGIKVCDRWRDFALFLSDMGERPSKSHSIERRGVNGDYEPNNCYWATIDKQALNRRNTVWVEWKGEQRKLLELCRENGVDHSVIRGRLRAGWGLEKAVETPRRILSDRVVMVKKIKNVAVTQTRPKYRGKPRQNGPPRSPIRAECERLFRLGWSFDAVSRKTGASYGTVWRARQDAKRRMGKI